MDFLYALIFIIIGVASFFIGWTVGLFIVKFIKLIITKINDIK